MIAMLLMLLGVLPSENAAVEQVDRVEVNHFFDDAGRDVFDQLIFYDWCPRAGRYQVRAWRLVKSVTQLPRRDWDRPDSYTVRWLDGETFRDIRSRTIKESWTQYEPELDERDYLPKELRRDLGLPPVRRSR